MRARFLSDDLKPEKIDLNRGSKCSDTGPILLVNEQRKINRQYVFYEQFGHSHYFLINDFVDIVIQHLEAQLLESNIVAINSRDFSISRLNNRLSLLNLQLQSGEIKRKEFNYKTRIIGKLKEQFAKGKITPDTWKNKSIFVSLEEAYASWSSPEPEIVKIKIKIPSLNYVRIYTGKSRDVDFYKVIAKATRAAIWQFFNDPVFRKFVKCE